MYPLHWVTLQKLSDNRRIYSLLHQQHTFVQVMCVCCHGEVTEYKEIYITGTSNSMYSLLLQKWCYLSIYRICEVTIRSWGTEGGLSELGNRFIHALIPVLPENKASQPAIKASHSERGKKTEQKKKTKKKHPKLETSPFSELLTDALPWTLSITIWLVKLFLWSSLMNRVSFPTSRGSIQILMNQMICQATDRYCWQSPSSPWRLLQVSSYPTLDHMRGRSDS